MLNGARRRILGGVTVLLASWPSAVCAKEELNSEVVTQLGKVIRWSGVLTSLLVIGGAWVLLKFAQDFVSRLGRRFPGQRLLFQKVATIFQFFVYVATIAVVTGLSVRLDTKVLAIIGGTIAVAIGFAIRDLVASFIAGITIMIDRPFQVGDRVTFGGEYGDITAIGLRSVRLQTLDNNTVTIPNNKFLTDITSCGNYGALHMQVAMDFYVGADQDVAAAHDIVTEAALTSRYVYLPKPVVVLVNQVIYESYVAVRLRIKAYVLDTRYEKAFETDVNLRVVKAFAESNVLPPAILHRTVDASRVSDRTPARARVDA
jgi:small-conductance mechanosensitive channel